MILGGIEAGGTKFVCVVGTEKGEILERKVILTTDPEETLNGVIEFFGGQFGVFSPVFAGVWFDSQDAKTGVGGYADSTYSTGSIGLSRSY